MGRAKLLLPWPTKSRPDGVVIDAVADAWAASHVAESLLIIRPDDEELERHCRCSQLTIVKPETAPVDMTESVQIGLRFLKARFSPRPSDGVFLSPADVPQLTSQVIDALVASLSGVSQLWGAELSSVNTALADKDRDPIDWPVLSPKFGDRSGHPVLFSYAAARRIFDLPVEVGIDQLVRQLPRHRVELPSEWMVEDCDTPAAYQEALARIHDQH